MSVPMDENFKIIEEKTLELTFTVEDESHGVFNALRHILMQNPDVEYAVYNIDHPLTGKPEMTIKTKRGNWCLGPAYTSCVTSGKSFNLSDPSLPCLII